jgi:palmitoyl-protein thioesterase
MLNVKLVKLLFVLVIIHGSNCDSYPVAIFHGIGDGCNFEGLLNLVQTLKKSLKTEVKCIEIGNGFITSWFMQFSEQAKEACEKIKSDEIFNGKFSVFGISQGTLIGRYIITKCDIKGQAVKYVSLDGPQMGIGTLPKINCPIFCEPINDIFAKFVYRDWFQKNLGPSGYFKYRYAYSSYLKYSTFLAELNNEKEEKDENITKRFKSLESVMLIKNKGDSVITPLESTWFEFYDNNGDYILPLQESYFYKADFIGLRYLIENNRVKFVEFEGEHVIFTDHELETHIIPFLI